MSRSAKIAFLVALILFVIPFVSQVVSGMWLNGYNVLLLAAFALVGLGISFDFRLYVDFLSMRTTKHGMNMGATILLVLVLLVCVNYLANAHNKSWDVTQEKLNSLSEQSTALMKNLKNDIEIKVFIKSSDFEAEKQKVKPTLTLFSDFSNRVKVHFINPYIDNDLAMQYLNPLSDRDTANVFVFVEHEGKKVRVNAPFDEAAIASAMTKATRSGEFKIYFIKGHGEKDIESADEQGLKDLVSSLGESSFKAEALSLIDRKEIPKDATAVAIIGPSEAYLDAELKWLREYIAEGGRLFIALDPGQHSNMANLTKTLGVEFANNYVVTTTPVVGGGAAMVLGRSFDGGSEITRNFAATSSYTLFYVASELRAAPDKAASIQVRELIKTDNNSFTVNDLRRLREIKDVKQIPETKPIVMAVESRGKSPDSKSGKEFAAVIFGDSDFLSNRSLMFGVNRDVALNTFASFAAQTDLLSIRPKMPKGTMIMLTGLGRLGIGWGSLLLPLCLLINAIVLWYRRRGA